MQTERFAKAKRMEKVTNGRRERAETLGTN